MSKRDYISLKVELAAALLQIPVEQDDGSFGPIVDLETAKKLSADQIRSLFHRDHDPIRKADGGPDEPWNITWRPIMPHRHKTATKDIPEMAKGRRITKRHEAFQRKMLARIGQETEPRAEKPKRRWKPEGATYDWGKGRYTRE